MAVINHTTTISQARNGRGWQWQMASVDQSYPPKCGCWLFSSTQHEESRSAYVLAMDHHRKWSTLSSLLNLTAIWSTKLLTCQNGSTGQPFVANSLGNGRYNTIHEGTIPSQLFAALRSLSPNIIPYGQLFFPDLRPWGTNRDNAHVSSFSSKLADSH